MTKTVSLTTHLRADPDTVWHWVKKPALLDYVAAPLIKFRLHEPLPRFEDWPARGHKASMMQFGVLPIGTQIIGIEYPARDERTDQARSDVRILRDNGSGTFMKRWDHWILVEPHPSGKGTLYTDRVHINAGLLTLGVAAFARVFYAHRQRRWRKLVDLDFAPLKKQERA